MSTEAPAAPAPVPNPTQPAPMAPPFGDFLAKSKGALAKHDRNKAPTAPAPEAGTEVTKATEGATTQTATTQTPPAQPAQQPASTTPPTSQSPQEDDIPKTITSANAEHWKRLHKLRDDAETRAKTFEGQLKSLNEELSKIKTKPEIPKEIEERIANITKERDEFSARLERLAIEQHPKFQAHFQPKLDAAIESAKAAAGAKADQVEAILAAPPTKWRENAIDALYAEMEQESKKYALAAAIQRYDEVRAERIKELDNHKEATKKLKLVEAEQETERRKQVAAQHELLYQEALKVADGLDSFKGDDADTHKATLQKFVKGEATRDAYLQTVAKGIDYEHKTKRITELEEKNKELEAAISELRGANPGLKTGAGNQTNAPAKVKTHYGESAFMGEVLQKLQRGPGK